MAWPLRWEWKWALPSAAEWELAPAWVWGVSVGVGVNVGVGVSVGVGVEVGSGVGVGGAWQGARSQHNRGQKRQQRGQSNRSNAARPQYDLRPVTSHYPNARRITCRRRPARPTSEKPWASNTGTNPQKR